MKLADLQVRVVIGVGINQDDPDDDLGPTKPLLIHENAKKTHVRGPKKPRPKKDPAEVRKNYLARMQRWRDANRARIREQAAEWKAKQSPKPAKPTKIAKLSGLSQYVIKQFAFGQRPHPRIVAVWGTDEIDQQASNTGAQQREIELEEA